MGFKELLTQITSTEKVTIAVVNPVKEEIFKALKSATDSGICSVTLFGKGKIIEEQSQKAGLDNYRIVECESDMEAARDAVKAVARGEASCLMKGHIATSSLMKEVLNSEYGLRGEGLLSHVAVYEKPDGRFLGVTDGGLNISPDLKEKIEIIRNAISLFRSIGVDTPKVAILSAVEVVNPAIPSTLDAASIDRMASRGQIKNAIIEGPLALDLAVSRKACELKDISAKVMGDADILVVPEIVSGNILGKSLTYLAGFSSGGIVVGAKNPVILLSRSDSDREKFNSILLGIAASKGGIQ